jgi:hypothetical protein
VFTFFLTYPEKKRSYDNEIYFKYLSVMPESRPDEEIGLIVFPDLRDAFSLIPEERV